MVIYTTLPPTQVFYPYIAINTNKLAFGLKYIQKHGKKLELVIIDSGIEVFRDCRLKDYPGGIISKIKQQVEIYDLVRSMVSFDPMTPNLIEDEIILLSGNRQGPYANNPILGLYVVFLPQRSIEVLQ